MTVAPDRGCVTSRLLILLLCGRCAQGRRHGLIIERLRRDCCTRTIVTVDTRLLHALLILACLFTTVTGLSLRPAVPAGIRPLGTTHRTSTRVATAGPAIMALRTDEGAGSDTVFAASPLIPILRPKPKFRVKTRVPLAPAATYPPPVPSVAQLRAKMRYLDADAAETVRASGDQAPHHPKQTSFSLCGWVAREEGASRGSVHPAPRPPLRSPPSRVACGGWQVMEALEFASRAHEGQRRKSGEPFIIHPIEARTLLTPIRGTRDTPRIPPTQSVWCTRRGRLVGA